MKYIFNFHKYYYYLVPLISVNENTIRSLLYEMVYNQVGYYHTIQYSSLRFIDVNKEEHTVQFKPEKKYESNNIIVGLLPKKVAYSLFQKYLNTFDENEVNKLFIQFNTQVEISLSSNFSDRIKDWFQHFFNVILDEEDYIKIVFYHTPQNAEVLREFLLNIFLVHFNWFMIPNTSSVYSFISTQLFSRIVGNIKNFFWMV